MNVAVNGLKDVLSDRKIRAWSELPLFPTGRNEGSEVYIYVILATGGQPSQITQHVDAELECE